MLLNHHELLVVVAAVQETLKLSVSSYAIAVVVGIAFCFALANKTKPLGSLVCTLMSVFRSTPELLLLFFVFYGGEFVLRQYFGLEEFDNDIAAVITLSLIAGAYLGEIFFSAVTQLDYTQIEAGRSLNLKPWRILLRIVLPEVSRKSIAGMGNVWLIVLKDSSLAMIIGCGELMRTLQIFASQKNEYLSLYVLAAVFYLIINFVSSYGFGRLETRLYKHVKE